MEESNAKKIAEAEKEAPMTAGEKKTPYRRAKGVTFTRKTKEKKPRKGIEAASRNRTKLKAWGVPPK